MLGIGEGISRNLSWSTLPLNHLKAMFIILSFLTLKRPGGGIPPAGLSSSCSAIGDKVMVIKPSYDYNFKWLQLLEKKFGGCIKKI